MNKQLFTDIHSNLELQTLTEKKLAEIWRELLNVSDIQANSDFFELGGNSLTVIKLLSRIEAIFGNEILLPDTVFATSQLREIAVAIDSAVKDRLEQSVCDPIFVS
jgi:acyl carrier protein